MKYVLKSLVILSTISIITPSITYSTDKFKTEYEELCKEKTAYSSTILNNYKKSKLSDKWKILLQYCNSNDKEPNPQTNQIIASEYLKTPKMQGPLAKTRKRIPIYKDEYKHLVKNDIGLYFQQSQIDRSCYIMNNVHSVIHELTSGEYNIINTVIANNDKYKFLIDAQESEQEQYKQLLKILTSDKFPQYYNNLIKELLNNYFNTKSKFIQYFEKLNKLFNEIPKNISSNKSIKQSFNSINAMDYDIYDLFFNNFFPLIFYFEKAPDDVVATCSNVKQTITHYKLSGIYEQYCNNFNTYINDIWNFLITHYNYLKAILKNNKFNEQQQQAIEEYKEYLKEFFDDFITNDVVKSIENLKQKCEEIINEHEKCTIGDIIDPFELCYDNSSLCKSIKLFNDKDKIDPMNLYYKKQCKFTNLLNYN